ncbi:hypothetical protein OAN24_04340 [Pseudodesulfovibrio sp.]|nr:hypothetical protein [Pseudodesulfovibrio sp.]
MSSENGKVHKLEAVKDGVSPDADVSPEVTASGVADAQRDMSKVAMIVSLLAVILLVIFFFGMNRNIAGLTDEVKTLGALREDVADLDQRVVQMKTEIPTEMKRMLAHDLVNEMTMQAVYLSDSFDDEALRSKMLDVVQGLKEVRDGLEK